MNNKVFDYSFGIILIIFGAFFVISPVDTFETIVFVVGCVLIAYSLSLIIGYIIGKRFNSIFSIGSSVVCLIAGLLLAFNTSSIIKVIPVLFGIGLLIKGLVSVIYLSKVTKDFKLYISPITNIVFGIILFILPVIPIAFAGIIFGGILILSGVNFIVSKRSTKSLYKVRVKK